MTLVRISALILVAASFVAAGASAPPAMAGSLSYRKCLDFQSEKSRLLSQGVQALLDKGPDWARDNLPPEKIQLIKRLIEVAEGLQFRCDQRGMRAMQKRMKDPAFKRWKSLKPPLPSRNPKFVELRNKAGGAKTAN